ncbi:MAG: cation:proton antiporter [Thermoleophilaceae bacterium]
MSLTAPALAVDTGFTFGEPFALALVGFAFALWAGIAALSHQSERAFSASIIYLLLGLVAAATLALLGAKPLDPVAEPSLLEHLSEVALIIAVFTTGLSLEADLRWRTWRKVAVLLAIVMPLTIAAIALFGMMAMGLSLGASILLGALLAPTDPVLAGDVGVGSPGEEALQREPRLSLSAEAGLNDGLAAPFLLLGILVAGNETGAIGRWLVADVLYAVGVAIVVGAVGGYLAAAGSVRLRDRRFLDERLGLYAAVPIALGVYGLAELVASYGLVAAFVGGLAFRRYDFGHEINRRAYDGAEVVEKFTELTVILLLGSIVTLSGLSAPGLAGWLLAPLLLLLIRPVLVGVLLVRSDLSRGERAFLGWFGVRGVAAVYYACVVVASGVLRPGEERTVFWTAVVCVAISIFLHGTTATAVSRRLLSQA